MPGSSVVRAAHRIARLQAVTAAFSEARTPSEVAWVAVTEGVEALDGRSGIVALLAEGDTQLDVIAMVGYPDGIVDRWRRISMTHDIPLTAAARTGKPYFIEMPEPSPSAAAARNQGDLGVVAIPLLVEGRALGTLGVGFAERNVFSAEDQSLIVALANQCAVALERARLYEVAQRARGEAEAANRAKDEFLCMLSHELRTPLTAILGWSNVLRTQDVDPQTRSRALATIERSARAQTRLIEDVLDVSRIVMGKLSIEPTTIEPEVIVLAAIDGARPAAEARRVSLVATFDPALGTMLADGGRLHQVVGNLLSNAVRFTPEGGRVEIQVEPHAGGVRIRVSDTGEGIAPDFLPHVFERFRQADSSVSRRHGGLGLGLAIAKHVIELHGGTLVAESAGPGKGATFTVSLPPAAHEASHEESVRTPASRDIAAAPPLPARLDGVRVLVVDDDADTCELVATILGRQGADVAVAASTSDALERLAQTVFHVLVSDIGMPGEDGYALMRRARVLLGPERALPALALTAHAGAKDAARAYKVGFRMHLTKPVVPYQLVAAVANLAVASATRSSPMR